MLMQKISFILLLISHILYIYCITSKFLLNLIAELSVVLLNLRKATLILVECI